MRRKPQAIDPTINSPNIIGYHPQALHQRPYESHLFAIEDVQIPELDIPQGFVDCFVELITSVIVDRCIELL